MAEKAILSENQQKVLEIISQSKDICQNFYLTGGTALAEFYLQHRFSEDLDFFSENEVDPQTIFSLPKPKLISCSSCQILYFFLSFFNSFVSIDQLYILLTSLYSPILP
ncbi:MAG: nucleotidyl transferase AbiEii/AbiGii toxin family protein [Candidatus Gribaldobacteria bacterium]|nr:nucleotidyl transferase AbiEii/AbiGii toxin family protein [Candidatus Gribaldobacteria bacterium]